ncbi:uncharacterized protein [Antennarius striatus]|uniref:uncharacterized protein n=1 Tax=Antennarius striatus TaxID=241820 RepID=UPI0035B17A96
MSSRVKIKVASQNQSDADVSSSLPLPRSVMPLSRIDPKQQYGGLPNPTLQYQQAAKFQPSYTSSSGSSGPADPLRGTGLRNQLLHQKTGVYSHRRTDGTCSAYSSPQVPKRDIPRSKDTLDLQASSLTHQALQNLQLKRTTNKNWTFGKYRLRSVDNAAEVDVIHHPSPIVPVGHRGGCLMNTKGANGNGGSGVSSAGLDHVQREARNLCRWDLQTSAGGRSTNKSSHHTFNMSRRGSEPGRVNMAAVAPFRFRFQVHEDSDVFLDDLSDCSSDSMEVCCDDQETTQQLDFIMSRDLLRRQKGTLQRQSQASLKERISLEGGGGWEGNQRRRRGSRKRGEEEEEEDEEEEGGFLRLPPLSFRCCTVQRQEGVL